MTDTTGMIDTSCPKCHHRFGWHGRVVDAPPCPRCGHALDRAALEHDQAELDNFQQILRELDEIKKQRASGVRPERWRVFRVASGLTLGQAARQLGITHTELSAIESGQCKPEEEMAKRMAGLYGG